MFKIRLSDNMGNEFTISMSFYSVREAYYWYYENVSECPLIGIFHASSDDVLSMY